MPPVIAPQSIEPVPVTVVIRADARKITLRLDHALRQAILVLPHKRFLRQGEKLLAQRQNWLDQQWQKLPAPMPFVPDADILLYGSPVTLRFVQGRGGAKFEAANWLIAATQPAAFAGRVRRALIQLARKDLQEQVARHAENLGLSVGKITVRDTRSRWGSCSSAGNLNFSWRLVCAPQFVLSYVAAHEVAHLREAHHGPAFWAEVEKTCPDRKQAKQYLNKHAPKLFAVGADA
ncbi:Zinc metalloprotease [hydrothermal vent metagenome]|uniref:Zinc metalloprotease n=1 Tax=hydrothermal vent metagenome TaxID=652676 RepID=A0A3B0R414_9ZZZZ